MVRIFVFLPFDPWKRHAVISRRDNKGIIELSPFFEGFKHIPQMLIEVFDFKRVIKQVVPHSFVIRPEFINFIDVG